MKNNKISGFTLIELLVVISIIAILSGVIAVNFNRFLNDSRVKEAQSQVIADIEKVRNSVVRTSVDGKIEFNSASDATSYRLTYSLDGKSTKTTGDIKIPNNVKLNITDGNTLNYTAPYGELSVTNRTIDLSGRGNAKSQFFVTGVTGKVIQ